MSAADQSLPTEPRAGVTIGFALLIAGLIGALFAVDFFLANLEHNEVHNQADGFYRQGVQQLQQGHAAKAVDLLRQAHTLDRHNRTYQLALIQALMDSGKLDQATALLDDLLSADPNDGDANLLMARLLVRESKTDDAEAYYHRAIYGSWPQNPEAHRRASRMELVKLLERRGDQKNLLAELLPLDSEVQNDEPMRLQIAKLYLSAGSPGRAIEVYHDLLQTDPGNAAIYTGLGEAQLEAGDYNAAMSAFSNAYRRKPTDPAARKNIELASAVTALDPTPRRLSSAEKFRRSTRILELAQAAMQSCAIAHGLATSDDLGRADVQLAQTIRSGQITNELSEERLSLAEQLWRDRGAWCGSALPLSQQPLQLIMEKLSK